MARISTTAGNQLRETQEQLFQAQMKEIGVDIKIANADSTKFFGEWLPDGNFDIANFAWVGTPFSISGSQAANVTGCGSNYGKYSNPKVDELFAQALGEFDEAKSAELGNQIDQHPDRRHGHRSRSTRSRPSSPGATPSPTSATTAPRTGPSGTPTLGAEGRLESHGDWGCSGPRAGGRPPARVGTSSPW